MIQSLAGIALFVAAFAYCVVKVRQDVADGRLGLALLGFLGWIGIVYVLCALIYVFITGAGIWPYRLI